MSDVTTYDLGPLDRLGEGEVRKCKAGPREVMVCRVEGRLYAIDDECSHAESSLSEGVLDGYVVTCALHFAEFDVRNGHHLSPPAFTGVRSYNVVEGPAGAVLEVPPDEPPDEFKPPPGRFQTR